MPLRHRYFFMNQMSILTLIRLLLIRFIFRGVHPFLKRHFHLLIRDTEWSLSEHSSSPDRKGPAVFAVTKFSAFRSIAPLLKLSAHLRRVTSPLGVNEWAIMRLPI